MPRYHTYLQYHSPEQSSPSSYRALYPTDIAQIYNFPSATGQGVTIGIIELGGGYTQENLVTYFRDDLRLPSIPNVKSVSVNGAVNNPGQNIGYDTEVQLDIEVVGAVAPQSNIVVYFSTNSFKGFYDAILTALTDQVNKPSIISISWGASEVYCGNNTMFMMNQLFQYAESIGVSVFCASGDWGATDGVENGRYNVDYPGSSPHVTSCGGTTLTATNNVRDSEVVWNQSIHGYGATGGGVSNIFPPPSYQQGYAKMNKNYGIYGRTVPDVSGVADPLTGYIVRINGQLQSVGGTSAVSPLFSGLTARICQLKGKKIGFWNPIIYQHPEVFTDVLIGNNDGYDASLGYDACSGLGVPNGVMLSNLF